MTTSTRISQSKGRLGMVALAIALAAGPASAGPQIVDPVDRGGPLHVFGYYLLDPTRGAQPFVLQLFADNNDCLHLQVTRLLNFAASGDLEMVLIAPNGTVWRDDNSGSAGACLGCPLIKVDPAPRRGWYLVQISTTNAGPPSTLFELQVDRHVTGDSACSPPTPAL